MSIERHTIVYLYDDKCYAELLKHGAFVSTVKFAKEGVLYEIMVENDAFDIVEDISIEIEEEY